jgi:hypothetical protein
MLDKDDCNKVDSYLKPVFEFIIIRFAVKAGLEKIKNADAETVQKLVEEICMTQYSLKAGLKKFGEAGEKAVTNELGQFHDMSVFEPINATKLTKEERKQALASLGMVRSRHGHVQIVASSARRQQQTRQPHLLWQSNQYS